MPDSSVSGMPRAGAAGLFHPRTATIITTKNSALASSALPELEPGGDRPGERRTDRARDVERDGAERDGARHVGARHEIVDARLLRGHVEREAGADQEREREQRRRPDHAEQCRRAERRGGGEQHDLRDQDHLPPVDDVRERAGEQPEQQRGRGARGLHQAPP